jgi:hypothetical protein
MATRVQPPRRGDGGRGSRAIELSSRVFVSCYEKDTKENSIWIGRVQKMGQKVQKSTLEYHNSVHLDQIPDGWFV